MAPFGDFGRFSGECGQAVGHLAINKSMPYYPLINSSELLMPLRSELFFKHLESFFPFILLYVEGETVVNLNSKIAITLNMRDLVKCFNFILGFGSLVNPDGHQAAFGFVES